jgi:hypothetical protein
MHPFIVSTAKWQGLEPWRETNPTIENMDHTVDRTIILVPLL